MSETASSRMGSETLAGRMGPRLIGVSGFTMTHEHYIDPTRSSRDSRSLVWVLEVFTQGRMQLSIENEKPVMVQPRWGVLYPPGTRYHERVDEKQVCHSLVIFWEPGAGDLLHRLIRRTPAWRLIYDEQKQLATLVRRIHEHWRGSDAQQLSAMGDFFQSLSLLLAAVDDGSVLTIGAESGDDLVTQARRFMMDNLQRSIGVNDIARHLNMSESGFAHAFRRQAGISPMQELRNLRVEVVKTQLLRNRLNLSEIAEMTGFADAFHLSHSFRRATGISPRVYRQQAGRVMGQALDESED